MPCRDDHLAEQVRTLAKSLSDTFNILVRYRDAKSESAEAQAKGEYLDHYRSAVSDLGELVRLVSDEKASLTRCELSFKVYQTIPPPTDA